jgi:hypothetical protein
MIAGEKMIAGIDIVMIEGIVMMQSMTGGIERTIQGGIKRKEGGGIGGTEVGIYEIMKDIRIGSLGEEVDRDRGGGEGGDQDPDRLICVYV